MKFLFFSSLVLLLIFILLNYSVQFSSAGCPACLNGGFCEKPSNSKCTCPLGFKGNQCEQLDCVNGIESSSNNCTCSPYWTGPSCNQCNENWGCFATNNQVCDTSVFISAAKQFTCTTTNSLTLVYGNQLSFDCSFPDVGPGACRLQTYDFESDLTYTEHVYCEFISCRKFNDSRSSTFRCDRTACNCMPGSELCNSRPGSMGYQLYNQISSAYSSAEIYCMNSTSQCTITQREIKQSISAICSAGECLRTAPELNKSYVVLTTILVICLIIVIILPFIYCCIWSRLQTIAMTEIYLAEKSDKSLRNISFSCSGVGYYLTETISTFSMHKNQKKVILKDISFSLKPGALLAIIGPSGAGKTTLLDILANKHKVGSISGTVLVNDRPRDNSFKRISGFVYQEDVLLETMTVIECLLFAANLRLPSAVSVEEKLERVKQVMKDLDIEHIAHSRIGGEDEGGISGGEKRRVSIGMELVTSPNLLFLDEPTTGLDAYNANSVVQTLMKLSKLGHTIIFTIHQPRYDIFQKFDKLLLLNRGKMVYFGDASNAVNHFENLGYKINPGTNPADALIDILSTSNSKSDQYYSENAIDNNSNNNNNNNMGTSTMVELSTISINRNENNPDIIMKDIPGLTFKSEQREIEFSTSWFTQVLYLSERNIKNFFRNKLLMPVHYISALFIGIVIGVAFRNASLNLEGVQNRLGSIVVVQCALSFFSMSAVSLFSLERKLYIREREEYYYPSAYFVAKALFDIIPLRVIPPIIVGTIAYYMIGLRSGFDHFLLYTVVNIIFNIGATSLCLSVGAAIKNSGIAMIFVSLAFLYNLVFGGFMMNLQTRIWYIILMQKLSLFYYAFDSLASNEIDQVPIILDVVGLPPIPSTGNTILNKLGIDPNSMYYDVVALSVLSLAYLTLSGLLLKFFVRERR